MTAAKVPKTPKAKTAKAAKPPKAPPPTAEAVAARLREWFAGEAAPALWKEADLKRRLAAKERPVLTEALSRLRENHEVLGLPQGKTTLYLFAEPLRGWLAAAGEPLLLQQAPTAIGGGSGEIFEVYRRLVRVSGGFPDVKIAALQAELDPVEGNRLPERLLALWREGRATFSQGDWSLADDETRGAAVELSGERYLLVRLEEAE